MIHVARPRILERELREMPMQHRSPSSGRTRVRRPGATLVLKGGMLRRLQPLLRDISSLPMMPFVVNSLSVSEEVSKHELQDTMIWTVGTTTFKRFYGDRKGNYHDDSRKTFFYSVDGTVAPHVPLPGVSSMREYKPTNLPSLRDGAGNGQIADLIKLLHR